MAPRPGHIDRLRRADLDSEGENERPRFERRGASRIRTLARLVWRGRHLVTGNDNCVPRVLVRNAAQVLSDEDDTADSHAPTAVIPRHAWRCAAPGLLMALGHCCAASVAPHPAKERGVLADCQQQHDRNDRCSKHGILAIPKGKTRAIRGQAPMDETPCVLSTSFVRHRETCGISPVGAENPPAESLGQRPVLQRAVAIVARRCPDLPATPPHPAGFSPGGHAQVGTGKEHTRPGIAIAGAGRAAIYVGTFVTGGRGRHYQPRVKSCQICWSTFGSTTRVSPFSGAFSE